MTFLLARTRPINNFFRNTQIIREMSKKAVVFLADGAEEIEAVVAIDVLRRGGIEVTVAGLPDANIRKCSRNVNIKPDVGISELNGVFDALVLPGGLGGSKALADCQIVGKLLKEQENAGRIIAAICAAPTAFKSHGVAVGKNITSYPAVEAQLTEGGQYNYKQDNVVIDGNVITSRGPGTAFEFSLALLEALAGKDKRNEIAKGMLLV